MDSFLPVYRTMPRMSIQERVVWDTGASVQHWRIPLLLEPANEADTAITLTLQMCYVCALRVHSYFF